jgi:hypothetical protein
MPRGFFPDDARPHYPLVPGTLPRSWRRQHLPLFSLGPLVGGSLDHGTAHVRFRAPVVGPTTCWYAFCFRSGRNTRLHWTWPHATVAWCSGLP